MTKFATAIFLSIIIILSPIFSKAEDKLKITASIKPIHSLVAAVTDGINEPVLLLGSSNSPHNYSLKPSDMKTIKESNIIFIVSYDMEFFLRRPLQSLKKDVTIVELSKTNGLTLLPKRNLNLSEDDEHHDDHHHGSVDLHIWLSPENAIKMTNEIANVLSKKDPKNAKKYQDNAKAYIEKITAKEDTIRNKLEPYTTKPYVVFHDGYQYFEKHFGLNFAGAISVPENEAIGAQRFRKIEDIITQKDAKCLFSEPQFSASTIDAIAQNQKIKVGKLDYLGINVEAGKEAYIDIIDGIADSIVSCFK
ncbi:MAG: zinc transporter substrate-binding protein [Rickettsiaceae bacterium]|jgi:zinc transport system substrate-binding protein|nr:zinc transporter substrate-binding protein [Rickettsiaceae bacterium]